MDVRDEIAAAIINEEVVSFDYTKQDGEEPQRRVFSPWEPLEDGKLVIGWDHDKAGIRSFKVDRITGVASYPAEHYAVPAT